MSTPTDFDDATWEVVHDLRLRGMVRMSADSTFVAVIERLTTVDVVAVRGSFVALTDLGRSTHAQWALAPEGSAAHAAAQRLHDDFADLNTELLAVCTAWQVRPGGVPNDHDDVTYDWSVIDRLERLHERAGPRVRRVARDLPRFAHHDRRLRHALARVIDADHDWFTSPRIDSYHTVWNQLHEDLLLALGRDRADEPTPGA